MTVIATELLATFESLSRQEKHEVLAEMLRRSGELPESLLTGNDDVDLAEELFQKLDADELNGGESGTK